MNTRRALAALAAAAALAIATPHTPRAAPADSALTATGEIAGLVRDASTGRPIAYANVLVIGTTLHATSDEFGRFLVPRLAPGPYTIRVDALGFDSGRRDTNVRPGQPVDVAIDLTRNPNVTIMVDTLSTPKTGEIAGQMAGPNGSGPIVAFELPDAAVLNVIRHARKVRVFRLDSSRGPILDDIPGMRPTREDRSLVAWPIANEMAPGRNWVRQVQRLLANGSSYRHGNGVIERCVPRPQFGLRFLTERDLADVVIDSNCAKVAFRSTVGPGSRGTLGAGEAPLRALVEKLRPAASAN